MRPHPLRSEFRQAIVCTVASVAMFSGCASVPNAVPYGHHAATPAALDQRIAGDAVKQLTALYPPATTRFNVAMATPDAFGTALVAGLREKGYAVMEGQARPMPQGAPTSAVSPGGDGLSLRYLLDQSATGDLYRVTLAIAHQQLSRAYLLQNGNPSAAGAWVRKE